MTGHAKKPDDVVILSGAHAGMRDSAERLHAKGRLSDEQCAAIAEIRMAEELSTAAGGDIGSGHCYARIGVIR